jgi:hypothetical protein
LIILRKWRESCNRDSGEDVVLAELQEEVLSESKEKRQSAQRRPRRRIRRRTRRWRDSGGGGAWCLEVWLKSAGVRDRI